MRALERLAPVGAVAVLAIGGCSGGSGTDREPTVVEESIIDRMAEPASENVPPGETEAARGEFVSECMAEVDLEYLGSPETLSLIEWLDLNEEEFQAEYGFGHSTTIDLAMAHDDFVFAVMEDYRASFETLSAAESERYKTRELECLQESYAEFGFPENGTVLLPNDSPIHEYTEQAYEATADDSRLAEATGDWSECMREQGYDFTDRDTMGLPLQQEAEPFVTAYATQGQTLVDAGSTWDELRVADVLDSDQLAELADLQQRELTVAAAHRHCIDQGHDIEAAFSEIYDEHLARVAGS